MAMPFKLAVLNSHPIQYFAPLYRRLAQEPDIDLTVYFCHAMGAEEYFDSGFGENVKWDRPLLEGYRYKILPNLWQGTRAGSFFNPFNPAIVRELYHERFDALWVHGHNRLTYLVAIVAARVLGIPVWMRGETHLLLQRRRLKKALRRPVMSLFYRWLCAACLPIGSRNAEFYHYHGVAEQKLFRVPYTIDNDFFIQALAGYAGQVEALRQKLHLHPTMPILLFVSKLTGRKNPLLLLQAYRHLRDQGIAAQLVFVGSGPEEPALKAYVAEHGLPDVHFLGFRNQSELPMFYALGDVFVLPSVNEPWGLVINEAMCARLPIVASDEIGAVADLVQHGKNGFTFPAGNLDLLTQYLATLCSDPGLRQRMGQASYDLITTWSYEACVRGIRAAMGQRTL